LFLLKLEFILWEPFCKTVQLQGRLGLWTTFFRLFGNICFARLIRVATYTVYKANQLLSCIFTCVFYRKPRLSFFFRLDLWIKKGNPVLVIHRAKFYEIWGLLRRNVSTVLLWQSAW